jgi:predicted naringenin-chalcone synthase
MQNMRRYIIENCFSYDTTEIVESFINNSLRNFLTTHKYLADQIKKDAINYGKNHLDVYNE